MVDQECRQQPEGRGRTERSCEVSKGKERLDQAGVPDQDCPPKVPVDALVAAFALDTQRQPFSVR